MLKFVDYHIVFQEVPGEVSLAINLSNCPNRCEDCHSPHLREDIGEILDNAVLAELLERYSSAITCVCFMGGDALPKEVEQCAIFIQNQTNRQIKTAWYSGKNDFPQECSVESFDYIKLGEYTAHLGGLDSRTTNQRFYRVDEGELIDKTDLFWRMENGEWRIEN